MDHRQGHFGRPEGCGSDRSGAALGFPAGSPAMVRGRYRRGRARRGGRLRKTAQGRRVLRDTRTVIDAVLQRLPERAPAEGCARPRR
ncbi:MAG: hypothetical protein EXR75_04055 [Myxococcales bacterium]|nr:hypothetical protein [Myxococcales bacterium]